MRLFRFVLALTLVAGAAIEVPASAKDRPPAPIGHRQPKPSDIPEDAAKRGNDVISDIDRQFDKKLNGICRGC